MKRFFSLKILHSVTGVRSSNFSTWSVAHGHLLIINMFKFQFISDDGDDNGQDDGVAPGSEHKTERMPNLRPSLEILLNADECKEYVGCFIMD